MGQIVGTAEESTAGVDEAAPPSPSGPITVSYRIVAGGRPRGRLLTTTVVEGGTRRVCGTAMAGSRRKFNTAQELRPRAGTALTPREFVHRIEVARGKLVEDASLRYGEQPGELAAWSRAWKADDYGGTRISLIEFDNQAHAESAAQAFLAERADDIVRALDVSKVRGARAVRLAGLPWLALQPPDSGPYLDYVQVLYGRKLVVISISSEAGEDSRYLELLEQADRAA